MTEQQDDDIIELTDELKTLAEKMDDDDLEEAIKLTLKIIKKPDVPASSAISLITQLQAISTRIGMTKVFYKTWGKSEPDARYKKDVYYTAQDAIDRLVDSLKYVVRAQNIVGS